MANKKLSAAKKRYAELKKKEKEQAGQAVSEVEGSEAEGSEVAGTPEVEEPEVDSGTGEPEPEVKDETEPEVKDEAEVEAAANELNKAPETTNDSPETAIESLGKAEGSEAKVSEAEAQPAEPEFSHDDDLDAFDAAIEQVSKEPEADLEVEPEAEPEAAVEEPANPANLSTEPTTHPSTHPSTETTTQASTEPPTETTTEPVTVSALQEENDRLKAHIQLLDNRIKSLETELANCRSGSNEDDLAFTPPIGSNATSRTAPDMYSESTNISSIRESMNGFKDFRLDMRAWQYMSGIGPIVSI